MVTPSMPPPTRFSRIHAPSAFPMRSADRTGAIPTILIGTLACPTIGAGDPVPAGARTANIMLEHHNRRRSIQRLGKPGPGLRRRGGLPGLVRGCQDLSPSALAAHVELLRAEADIQPQHGAAG